MFIDERVFLFDGLSFLDFCKMVLFLFYCGFDSLFQDVCDLLHGFFWQTSILKKFVYVSWEFCCGGATGRSPLRGWLSLHGRSLLYD